MRKALILIAHILLIISAQPSAQVQVSCYQINQQSILDNPAGISSFNCISLTGNATPAGSNSNVDYDIKSNSDIFVTGESFIRPGLQKSQRLLVEKSDFGVVVVSPANPVVEKFAKLELGISLPQSIMTLVNNYINEVPTQNFLNPFEPLDIDIKATFQRKVGNSWLNEGFQHGFYMIDYTLCDTNAVNSKDWFRIPISSDYPFRIRYAPKNTGPMKVLISININGWGLFNLNPLHFNVSPSSNPGYLKVAQGGRYFERDNEFFFPIGQNEYTPRCVSEYCADMDLPDFDPYTEKGIEEYFGTKSPVKSYRMYRKVLEKLKNSGANYFRLMVTPWGTEIEYEKLGNYYDRMEQAWELDKIVETAEELDLLHTIALQVQIPWELTSVYGIYKWDFSNDSCGSPGWCYGQIPGINNPADIFTNTTAKRHYKNRLRYYISRYGYSTSVGIFDLISEINNVGNGHQIEYGVDQWGALTCIPVAPISGCYKDCSCINELSYFQQEMLAYIKNELLHQEHILSVSYAGIPNIQNTPPCANSAADNIFYSNSVDIINYNAYSNYNNYFKGLYDVVKKYQVDNNLNKPVFMGELGLDDEAMECDNLSGWVKNIWIPPFLGFAGTGMNWIHQQHAGFNKFQHYGRFKEFMEGEDFRPAGGFDWFREYAIRQDKKAEMFVMKGINQTDNTSKKAVGIVVNRTVNYRSVGTPPCSQLYDATTLNKFGFSLPNDTIAQAVAPGSGGNALKIPDMGILTNYTIEWYNCLQGYYIVTEQKQTNADGSLTIETPIYLSGDMSNPMLAFKAYKTAVYSAKTGRNNLNNEAIVEIKESDSPFLIANVSEAESAAENDFRVSIFPNPTSGVVVVNISSRCVYRLFTQSGTEILNGNLKKGDNTLNLEMLTPGMYFIELTDTNTGIRKTEKIIRL